MLDMKKVAKSLGVKADEVTDDMVVEAISAGKAKPADLPAVEIAASHAVDPVIVSLMAENRKAKLATLVSAGLITPGINEIITKRYVEKTSLTLSLSKGGDDGFDCLFEVLTQNHPVELGETSGPQVLELANTRATTQANPVQADVARRRKEAGLD